MLSSTSLLHGNCIFNRNNTVATQQGMKTYWLCKSYRITMCRARCITHQGRVISATGMHNHQPHMKGSFPNSDFIQSGNGASVSNNGNSISVSMRLPSVIPSSIASTPGTQNASPPAQNNNNLTSLTASAQHDESVHHLPNETQPQSQSQSQTQSQDSSQTTPNTHHSPASTSHHHHPHHHHGEHTALSVTSSFSNNNSAVSLQNMMQTVLSQNNLMHLTNIAPILNPMQGHHMPHLTHLNSVHHTNDLHATPSQGGESNQDLHSPDSPRSSMQHVQLGRHHLPGDVNRMSSHHQSHHSSSMHTHPHQSHQSTHSHENSTAAAVVAAASAVLSSPVETPPQQGQPTPDSDSSVVHHNLANDSSSFKLEQM